MSTNAPRQPNKNEKKLSELYPKHAPTPNPPRLTEGRSISSGNPGPPTITKPSVIIHGQGTRNIEEKTRTIVQNYFVTSDGKEFLDKGKAIHHQNLLDGTSIVCTNCNGKGEVDWCGDGMMVRCSQCNGKGYLVRTWGADK
jgi:hypothetical protein